MPEAPGETRMIAFGHHRPEAIVEAAAGELEAPAQVDVLADRQVLGEAPSGIEGRASYGQVGAQAGGKEARVDWWPPAGGATPGSR